MKSQISISAKKTARRTSTQRAGTATVELAVCLPIIIIVVFGAIEIANFIHLKQNLTICAYEAAKEASKSGKTNANAIARFQQIATAKGVTQATVTVTPNLNSQTPAGQIITVTAQASAESNWALPIRYFRNRQLQARVVMVRLQN